MKLTRFSMIILSLLISTSVFAEDAKDIRVGLKLGAPNIVGLFGEYVLPVMDRNISINVDFSYLPSLSISGFVKTDDYGKDVTSSITPMYFNISANYYFMGNGEGLYAGLGYGRFSTKLDVSNIIVDNFQTTYTYNGVKENVNLSTSAGKANASFGANIISLKLGWKWTSGMLNYGVELGYGMATYDDKVTFDGSVTLKNPAFTTTDGKSYPANSTVDLKQFVKDYDIKKNIPNIITNGFPMINFNIGLSF